MCGERGANRGVRSVWIQRGRAGMGEEEDVLRLEDGLRVWRLFYWWRRRAHGRSRPPRAKRLKVPPESHFLHVLPRHIALSLQLAQKGGGGGASTSRSPTLSEGDAIT